MAIPGNGVQTMGPYNERLASLPEVPRRRVPGDGTEPGGSGASLGQPASQQPAQQGQKPGAYTVPPDDRDLHNGILAPTGPTLEDADDPTLFLTCDMLVRSQERLRKNRYAIDLHFGRVRDNIPFSRLEKIPNQSIWVAKLPNGMSKESTAAVPNKADDLCNKVEDTLMADPPKPDPMPHVEDESAKAAAELASEFLEQDGGEAGTNDIDTYRWALSHAFTGATSYLHYWVDRTGGGSQPLQKMAHPQATDPAKPLVAIDPATGVEMAAQDPILRYVSPPSPQAPAGQFVEDASQADRVWLPAIRIDRLPRAAVTCFPATAPIETADGCIITDWCTLAEARQLWPATAGKMTMEQLDKLTAWQPPFAPETIVPYAFRGSMGGGQTGPSLDQVGTFSPLLQKRMYFYCLYIKASPEYKGGYYAAVNGANGGTRLEAGALEYAVKMPKQGTATRSMDIPVVAVTPMHDTRGKDPTGWPFISRFAGSAEASATLLAAFADVCDNMLHPHVYLRTNADVDEDDWFDRLTPMLLSPTDPEPTYEQFPQLPPILPLYQELKTDQDTSSGLTATAQGLDTPNSVSGVSKNLTVRQALISLSGFQQKLHAAMTRGWRIKCQLAQAEFTTPQMIQYSGEEGSAQTRWWTGEDMAGVDRVGIQPGTGTMMTPEGKAQLIAFLQGQQWLPPDQAAQVALPGIRMDLGLPDDPYEQAIERSIGVWLQGPSPQWLAAKQQQDQAIQAAETQYTQEVGAIQAQAQASGAPSTPPPPFQPPPLPPLPTPFPARPNDGEGYWASVQAKRLSKLFMDPKFTAQPQPWQQVVVDVYQRALQVITPPPMMPALPKGVVIQAKGDASTIAAEEQAAMQGVQGGPPAPPPNGGPVPPHGPHRPGMPPMPQVGTPQPPRVG